MLSKQSMFILLSFFFISIFKQQPVNSTSQLIWNIAPKKVVLYWVTMCYYFWPTPLVNCWVTQIRTVNITKGFMNLKNLSNCLEKPLSSSSSSFRVKQHKFTITQCVILSVEVKCRLSGYCLRFSLTTPATLQMFTNIAAYCKHFFILIFSHRRPSAPITCSCPGVALEGLFFPFVELGTACLDWVGPGWVVEGNRQLEMGAHVECEELGCVVGGPFKPNKLREVRGLVWRPWINKPSEMTMRCADICHHTSLASKHKPPKPSLLLSPFHVLCPTWCLSQLPLSLSSPLVCLPCLYLHLSESDFFPPSSRIQSPQSCSPPSTSPYLHSSISSLPRDSIHRAVHPCMAGCLSGVLYVL